MQSRRLVWLVCAVALGLVRAAPAQAVDASAADDTAHAALALQAGEPRVRARLVVHPDDLGKPELRAGVLLEIAPGWHVYGEDAGETGIPTRLAWSAEGGTVASGAWPPTVEFGDAELGISAQGYAGRVLLPARARFADASGSLAAELSLLACSEECIPASASLALPLSRVAVRGAAADASRAAFGDTGAARAAATLGWLEAILLAFAGGLLLNLMPCVLPVLAIKALALSELAGTGPAEARRQALAYGVGVIGSLLALAAGVAALRAAGTAVGWGFQFQEPIYLAVLGAVLVLFALNLFGVFEIQVAPNGLASIGAEASGARRSFFDGLLTVALATPCSAPFLGTAVGFALAGEPAFIFPIFASIGAGLALPLALVAASPRFARWLPRPGAWMQELRALLGFGLLATVVWLTWVLGRNADVDTAARWLGWLLTVALLGWGYGARQRRGRRTPVWLGLAAASLVLMLGFGAVIARPVDSAESAGLPGARAWSRADVDAALRVGRPVFVVFTADWCLTCKANERLVLRDARVRQALAEGGFEVLVGDWTRRDAEIAAELARHGRSGVPFYAVFAPDAAPKLLPELLVAQTVLDALADAQRAAAVSRITRQAHAASMQPRGGR